jgi:hypothetical protein
MRQGLLVFAAIGGLILVIIAARYGYKLADDPADALVWGFLYGFITLGGLFGHGYALRVWRHDKRAGAFVFAVSGLALVISLSNSLGSMASRGNETTAKRQQVAENVDDLKGQLKAKEKERDGLKFDPADENTLKTANEAAATATLAKYSECKSGRGPACIEKENAEKLALEKKAKVAADKAAADQAKKLDNEIKELRKQINEAGPVLETNSQGRMLARLFGFPEQEAAKLLTWQNFGMGIAAELMVVAMTISYEVLTHAHHEVQSQLPVPQAPRAAERAVPIRARELEPLEDDPEELEPDEPEPQPLLARPRPVRQVTSQREPFGNVIDIIAKVMAPAAGSRVEIKEAYFAYAQACKEQGKKPFPPDKFATEIKRFCKEARVKIHAEEHGVYLLNVRLKALKERELEGQAS